MRHEVAIAERAARRAVQAERIDSQAVRLQQRRDRADHSRQGERRDEPSSEPGAGHGARAPEARGAGQRERHRSARRPPVGGEQGGDEAERQERHQELIDARQPQLAGTREAAQRGDRGDRVQDELLGHEEAIELELLVDNRGDHDRDRADLEDDESGAFEGGRRGRRRVRANAVGLEHAGMYPGTRAGAGRAGTRRIARRASCR